ncbi:MAG: HupE/UreJ family protein [Acidobacteriota bacterium]
MLRGATWWTLALLLLCSTPVAAHRTNLSTARVAVEGSLVRYQLTLSAHDLAVALGIETDLVTPVPRHQLIEREPDIAAYLRQRLRVASAGAACLPDPPRIEYGRLDADVRLDLAYRCPSSIESLSIAYFVFFEIDSRHRAVGQIEAGGKTEEFLFDRTLHDLEISLGAAARGPWLAHAGRFVVLGIEHILIGIDHILFLLALLLVNRRFSELVKVITAFTAAHSITLGLAWYGLVNLPSWLVESAIAASIVYVAIDNLSRYQNAHRGLLAFGFGLVHGLGFYGVLSELDLASGSALVTLLSFNLGVEIGQVALVAVFYPFLVWSFRQTWYDGAMKLASAGIFALGAFWLVERTLLG